MEIGIGTKLFEENPEVCYTLEKSDLFKFLPDRKKNSHKGSYGKILMITGSKGDVWCGILKCTCSLYKWWRSGTDLYRRIEPDDFAAALTGSNRIHLYRI